MSSKPKRPIKFKKENKKPSKYNDEITTLLRFPKKDLTGLTPEENKLIAIHAVEIIEGKFTGKFFHSFIEKRTHDYDYMYYLAEYNYYLEEKKKIETFLNFVKNKTIVSHNIKFDIGFINKYIKNMRSIKR